MSDWTSEGSRYRIRQSNLIEDIDDPLADALGFVAWEWLTEQTEITHEVIWMVHRVVTASQLDLAPEYKGVYRPIHRYVGRHVLPAPDLVYGCMDEWLKNWMHLDPKPAHIEFERIHPFVDGNGRVGRLLYWKHQMYCGHLPTLLLASERQSYYAWFA